MNSKDIVISFILLSTIDTIETIINNRPPDKFGYNTLTTLYSNDFNTINDIAIIDLEYYYNNLKAVHIFIEVMHINKSYIYDINEEAFHLGDNNYDLQLNVNFAYWKLGYFQKDTKLPKDTVLLRR